MSVYLKENPDKDKQEVNAIMCDMMSVIPECALGGELDDELIHTSYNYVELEILRDRNGEYEPQMIKNIRIPLKDHLHVM